MDAVFGLAREQRDAWQAWPSRVSALMAAALGVSAHAVEVLLVKEVKAHLATLAAVDVERIAAPLRGKGTVQ